MIFLYGYLEEVCTRELYILNNTNVDFLVNHILLFVVGLVFVVSLIILFLKKNQKKVFKAILVILILLSGLVLSLFVWLIITSGTIPDYVEQGLVRIYDKEIIIENTKIIDNKICLTGQITENKKYEEYTCEFIDGSLYITLYGKRVDNNNKVMNFELEIENKFSDLDKIYLKSGGNNVKRLIYEK